MGQGIGLTTDEIQRAFHGEALAAFPPILAPKACADMFGVSLNTLYFWLENGQLQGSHRRRGKHQIIWRDRAILLSFNGSIADVRPSPRRHLGAAGIGLTDHEINQAFAKSDFGQRFGPILNAEQMADLIGLSRSTIYFWVQCGHFSGTVTKRGKRQLFWRNRAVAAIFNGPDWSENCEK